MECSIPAHAGLVSMTADGAIEEQYSAQSKLLQQFTRIPNIDRAWVFGTKNELMSRAMFSISQPNLLANKKRKYVLYSHIIKEREESVRFHWSPFPVEMENASLVVPSPSGSKLFVVRNSEKGTSTQFEIWCSSQLEKEFHIPQSVHGQVFADGWFEGISWNSDETAIAYVAEDPPSSNPAFDLCGYKKDDSSEKDCGTWKGQGEWEESWGESYDGKRQSALFVIDVTSGTVHAVKGIERSMSVGQVSWAPPTGPFQFLVFVGWQSGKRKLGMKYCYNRPCALYAVKFLSDDRETSGPQMNASNDTAEGLRVMNLTPSINSAFFPRFSPDGRFLVFLSANSCISSGVHSATNSLHKIHWPVDGNFCKAIEMIDVVSIVGCPEDGGFPGLYCSSILNKPWISDGSTMILTSVWRSSQVILSVNVLSGAIARISPNDSDFSWDALALDGDIVMAVCSSPIDVPRLMYGFLVDDLNPEKDAWRWLSVPNSIFEHSNEIKCRLSELQFNVIKIPVSRPCEDLRKGTRNPFEAIFISSKCQKNLDLDPLIVVLHGGPHSASVSSFSKSIAFLASLRYSLLIVNYRGSLGFGEEALQSLPGKVGSQDVNDVLAAINHIIDTGIAHPAKIALLGGSHGGFLTAHLIGQAPDKFAAAAMRNPVCNLALMVGTTDIPDWCYVEAYGGSVGKSNFTEAPSSEHLSHFYNKSPISYISRVKTPTLFLLGARDLRVPASSGLQYARALKGKGVDTKVIVFPEDVHSIDKPQSDFESFLNIGVWFNKYCK